MKINSKKSNLVKTAFCWAVGLILVQTAWWVARNSWTGRAPLEALFRHVQVSKWGKSGLVGKVWMSTFQPKWNFWIWWPFAPPKLQSPKTASCVSKRWQKVIFCLFFDFLEAQNLVKFLGNGWESVTFHEKSRNAELSQNGVAQRKSRARRATHWWRKPVFGTKNSQLTKFSPNFLKFGLGVPNKVPCSVKEALAKIWSGSGLFLRFSALLNLLGSGDCIFDISLKPWHLCKKWRRFFFLGMFWTKTSLRFPKLIFDFSETSFEWNLSRCVKQGILSKWSEMKGIRGF